MDNKEVYKGIMLHVCEYYTYSNITIYSTIEWCWHGTNNTAIKIGVPAHPTITK